MIRIAITSSKSLRSHSHVILYNNAAEEHILPGALPGRGNHERIAHQRIILANRPVKLQL